MVIVNKGQRPLEFRYGQGKPRIKLPPKGRIEIESREKANEIYLSKTFQSLLLQGKLGVSCNF